MKSNSISKPLRKSAKSGKKHKWMQDLKIKKGALHKALSVPAGKKISKSKLAKGAKSKSPLMRKRVALAKTFAKARHK